MLSPADRLHQIVTQTHPARPIAMARIGLGVVALVRAYDAATRLLPITELDLLRMPWAPWMPELTSPTLFAILVTWFVSAALFTVGLRSQLSGYLLSASMAAVILVDQQGYSNHLYLFAIIVALLTASKPGAALSIDASRLASHATDGSARATVAGWPLFLIKAQVSIVYFFAAITKINETFLSGIILHFQVGTGLVDPPDLFTDPPVVGLLAIGAVGAELILAVMLWRRRGRILAVTVGAALHASIALLMAPVVQLFVFAGIMGCSYIVFLTDPTPTAAHTAGARPQQSGALDAAEDSSAAPITRAA